MKKSATLLRLLSLILALALLLCALVACGGDDIGDRPDDVDSDGDGIPDYLDKEADDSTDNDNVVDIGSLK